MAGPRSRPAIAHVPHDRRRERRARRVMGPCRHPAAAMRHRLADEVRLIERVLHLVDLELVLKKESCLSARSSAKREAVFKTTPSLRHCAFTCAAMTSMLRRLYGLTVATTCRDLTRLVRVLDRFPITFATAPPVRDERRDRLQVREVVVIAAPDVEHGAINLRRR